MIRYPRALIIFGLMLQTGLATAWGDSPRLSASSPPLVVLSHEIEELENLDEDIETAEPLLRRPTPQPRTDPQPQVRGLFPMARNYFLRHRSSSAAQQQAESESPAGHSGSDQKIVPIAQLQIEPVPEVPPPTFSNPELLSPSPLELAPQYDPRGVEVPCVPEVESVQPQSQRIGKRFRLPSFW